MKMNQKKQLQVKLKEELELLTRQKLSDAVAWEAMFNLSGFFNVLRQMKNEIGYAKTV